MPTQEEVYKMKVYINNVLQNIDILPSNTPSKDESLETFSFALISNSNPLPLAAGQEVKVDFLGNGSEVAYFFLASDSVETCSLKPLRYKHNISCVQNTRKLSKHMVRNSVFTQPFYLTKSSFNTEKRYGKQVSSAGPQEWRGEFTYSSGNTDGDLTYNDSLNYKSQKLTLSGKERITSAALKISFQYGITPVTLTSSGALYANDHNGQDIVNRYPNVFSSVSIHQGFTLKYTDINSIEHTIPLTPQTFGVESFDFNNSYDFSLIVELAKQGCNDFEILFDTIDMVDSIIGGGDQWIEFWMMQVSIVANIYYYNCYDVLELLIERQKKQTSLKFEPALFSLPQSGELYDLLQNTIAPNFTFTDLTMYECVADVFRLFDAIFTMNQYGVLGIEYFNDLSEGEIPNTVKFAGRTLALGEDKYTNGLVANYQDARTIEKFPNNDSFAHLRSAEFGVPEAQDHNFIVPHNIDNVQKVEIIITGFHMGYYIDPAHTDHGNFYSGEMVIDITPYVMEQSLYSALATGDMNDNDYVNNVKKKSNCIFFVKGDNKIQCGYSFKSSWNLNKYVLQNLADTELVRLAGMLSHKRIHTEDTTPLRGNWHVIKMRAVYVTTINGKTKVHSITNKYDGETLIDQANGGVDLNKMGLNMLGTVLKMGQPTLNASHTITTWANRVKVGQYLNYEGSIWVANVVNYTFMNGRLQGKISFVKNFNQLSLKTQLLREKRMSNISKDLVQKSEEILTDYIYYSSDPAAITSVGEAIHFDSNMLQLLIKESFDINGATTKIGDVVTYDDVANGESWRDIGSGIYIPLIRYGAGNTINFEMAFEHPLSAGNQTKYEDNKYFTNIVRYSDANGFLEEITLKAPREAIPYTQDFPMVEFYTDQNHDNLGGYFFRIKNYKAYKQPNEIFALNYQLAFLPIVGRENIDFLGSWFINNNSFVKELGENSKARYIAFMAHKSSILDSKAIPYFVKKPITQVLSYEYVNQPYKFSVRFIFEALTQQQLGNNEIVSWAIVDESDNVLFASNQPISISTTYVNITFVSKQRRFN